MNPVVTIANFGFLCISDLVENILYKDHISESQKNVPRPLYFDPRLRAITPRIAGHYYETLYYDAI